MLKPMHLPEQMTLYPSKLKWIGVSAIGFVFVAGGLIWALQEPGITPWICIAFFALVAGTGLVQLLGGSSLQLDSEGFEQNMLGRKFACRWEDVSEFGTWRVSGNQFVVFNRVKDRGTVMGPLNESLTGASAQLGDTFGMKAEDLAETMNAFRDRALHRIGKGDF